MFHESLFDSKLLLLSDSRYWQLLLLSNSWEFVISFLLLIYSKINTLVTLLRDYWWKRQWLTAFTFQRSDWAVKKEKTLFGELSIRLSDLADSLKTDSFVGLRNVHISKAWAFRASGWLTVWERIGVKAALTILSFCLTRMEKVSTRPRHLTQFPQWKVIWQRKSWEHTETEKYKRIIK